MASVKFVTRDARFRAALTARVEDYFRERGLSKHWDWRMMAKTIFYLGGYASLYAWLLFQAPSKPVYLAGMALVGLFTAAIGFNIGHDAAHRGYAEQPWLNALMAHSFTIVGAHVYTWKIIHNVIHHTYPNVPGADGDLNTVAALRFYDSPTPRVRHHRFQHLYAFGLYSLTSLVWVFSKDFVHMRKKEHCGYKKPTPPAYEWVVLYGGKALHFGLFLVVPWLVFGLPLWQVAAGFVLMHMMAGLALAVVFAVGHLVDSAQVVDADANGQLHDDWAAHQLRTTANFAIDSWFFYWTVGGLNFQVEHHLFPTICHVHYKALAPIVRETAAEFGLPYNCYDSLPQAIAAHMRHLKRYGQPISEIA